LIPILRSFKSPLIAIVGNTASPLARLCDVVIDASVQSEADVYNLAPTSSSTLAMALGDALALTLMQARGFSPEAFARFHPNGQLGRNLNLRVQDVMQSGAGFPYVHPTDSMKSVMVVMTKLPLGAACVVDSEKQLLGLITDGDIRRALLEHDDIRSLCAADIMTQNPITVYPQMPVQDALNLMENRPSKISVLPVVENQICVGLIRIHDIYSS
jgi:arabinose-5-phosphate isomerase